MEILLGYALKAVVLPPGINVVLGLLGFWWLRRRRHLGLSCLVLSVLSLWLLSLPAVSQGLAAGLETVAALDRAGLDRRAGPEAIVVLGGGRYLRAPEYGGTDRLLPAPLERLIYAGDLHRRTGLPILVSGGVVAGGGSPEAELMAEVLLESFQVRPAWLESRSRNTAENARYSRVLLAEEGIDHVVLVTHALHMPRARAAFRQAGFTVTPAPMGFRGAGGGTSLLRWLPDAGALALSRDVLHELLGMVWYRLRYRT